MPTGIGAPNFGRLFHDPAERHPDDELHHDEERTSRVAAQIEGLHDVWARDVCGQAGFVEEHLHEVLVVGQRRQHTLYGDELLEAGFAQHSRGVHLGHPSGCDPEEELVAAHRARRAVDSQSGRLHWWLA